MVIVTLLPSVVLAQLRRTRFIETPRGALPTEPLPVLIVLIVRVVNGRGVGPRSGGLEGQLSTLFLESGEEITLPDQIVDMIVVGNASTGSTTHGRSARSRAILNPRQWVVLLWNLTCHEGSPFGQAFEQFWRLHIEPGASFAQLSERPPPHSLP